MNESHRREISYQFWPLNQWQNFVHWTNDHERPNAGNYEPKMRPEVVIHWKYYKVGTILWTTYTLSGVFKRSVFRGSTEVYIPSRNSPQHGLKGKTFATIDNASPHEYEPANIIITACPKQKKKTIITSDIKGKLRGSLNSGTYSKIKS